MGVDQKAVKPEGWPLGGSRPCLPGSSFGINMVYLKKNRLFPQEKLQISLNLKTSVDSKNIAEVWASVLENSRS